MQNAQGWILPAIGIVTAVWAFFQHRSTKPTDAERADLLRTLAEDAAAVIVALYPTKPWAELVNMVVQRLLAMPGVPTKNTSALEGAAATALTVLGKAPGAK